MYALSGYINKNAIIADENISSFEGCKVIITVLDAINEGQNGVKISDEGKKKAARELAGLWREHDNKISVEETVRSLRRGRSFDI